MSPSVFHAAGLSLAIGLAGSPAAATPARPVTLPMQVTGAQIVVDGVSVDGQGPFRFVLDTGAQGWGRIDSALADRLRLPVTGEVEGRDGSGRAGMNLRRRRVDSLAVGPLTYSGLELMSRDYNGDVAAVRGRIDGVLGADLFRDGVLTLDFAAQTLTFGPGALPPPDGARVLALKAGRPVPTIDVRIGDLEGEARIDTGSMGSITLGGDVASRLRLAAPPVQAGAARTVSGTSPLQKARLDGDLRIGALVLHNPEVFIVQPFRGVNLGTGFLSGYRVALDLAHGRASLTPGAGPGPRPVRYGMMVRPPQGPVETLPLLGVDGVAERAGLRPGDEILSLNGVPIRDAGDRLAELMHASPLVVKVRRDGKDLEFHMSLEP